MASQGGAGQGASFNLAGGVVPPLEGIIPTDITPMATPRNLGFVAQPDSGEIVLQPFGGFVEDPLKDDWYAKAEAPPAHEEVVEETQVGRIDDPEKCFPCMSCYP